MFTMQTLQVHVPGALLGALSPAAPQLKPPDGFVAAAGAEAGRGSSQEAHFVFIAPLSTMQTLHVHVPGAFVGALSPAADQSKPPVGPAGLRDSDIAAGTLEVVPFVAEDSGRGSSHATHLVLAESLLIIQTSHFHEPLGAFMRDFIPAASQLKPVELEAGFAPKANANVGSKDESAAKAALRSLV